MERAGRDPDELVVSMLWAFLAVDGVQHLVDTIGAYAEAGMHHLVGVPSLTARHPANAHERLAATIEDLQRFAADVLPAVR
jgi:hypothetical protein